MKSLTISFCTALAFCVPAFGYETCDSKNDYLESGLAQTARTLRGEFVSFAGRPTQASDIHYVLSQCMSGQPRVMPPFLLENIGVTPRPLVPTATELKCMETAQAGYPLNRFVHCKSASDTISAGRKFKIAPRPCLSENYVFTSATLLKTVAHCGDLDARELFGLWNHESGLHMNMVSHTGALGSTQLTSGAVNFVRTLDTYRGEFKDQGLSAVHLNLARDTVRRYSSRLKIDPRCTNLATLAEFAPRDSSQSCELLSSPVMPTAAFIIGAKNYLAGKKIFEEVIPRLTRGSAHAAQQSQAEIVFALSQYSYNGGIAGIMNAFKSYFLLNSFTYTRNGKSYTVRPRNLSTAELLSIFPEYLRKNYGSSRTSAGRRSEVATYLTDPQRNNGIREMLAKVESNVGAKCF